MAGENRFKTDAITYLKAHGAYVRKNWGTALSGGGVPDLFVCYRGRFIAFELKNPADPKFTHLDGIGACYDAYASKGQKVHNEQIRKAGGRAYVVKSIDQIRYVLDHADDP